jgi:uncharacterized membrane protein YfcA
MDFHVLVFVVVGFIAQLIDGALGMAYGVSSNTFLLSIGIPPAAASASVHMAECVTTAISGASHWKLGNIDKVLIKRLAIPGVLGGIVGAYVLTSINGNAIKPYVSGYLILMGFIILAKAVRRNHVHREVRTHLVPLGLVGGLFDAIGGGGWGPIVTTTLVARGNCPRFAIGSVNFSEFFVTFAQSVTFLLTLGVLHTWRIILGLLVGGALAAPLAALAARKIPTRILMAMVGILIIVLSARTIVLTLR